MAGPEVAALSGGIGGAKLALGLSNVLGAGNLTVVANTGDDFEHLGLHISPDIDTLMYTLAGVSNTDTGWGRAAETWSFMTAVEELGGPTWFRLGDKDMAVHVLRTNELHGGKSLSEITKMLARQFGVRVSIVPMTDDHVRTVVDTQSGSMPFQDYFVRHQCQPEVRRIRFTGAESARPSPGLKALMENPGPGAYVICPSNPYLSIDPIMSLDGVRSALRESDAPVVAVSPVIGGKSVKGPTAKIMRELGMPCSPIEIAAHYQGLVDGMVIDHQDAGLAPEIEKLGITVETTGIIMRSLEDRIDLANSVVSFAHRLKSISR